MIAKPLSVKKHARTTRNHARSLTFSVQKDVIAMKDTLEMIKEFAFLLKNAKLEIIADLFLPFYLIISLDISICGISSK